LHGRNGAGKSTLVKAILANAQKTQPESKLFAGHISVEPEIKIGVYEQEIDEKYWKL
jgi:ABC-type Mn2+/Zn2+ transport system ATPase subunit